MAVLLVVQILGMLHRARPLAVAERKVMEEALGLLRGLLVVVRLVLRLLAVRLVVPAEVPQARPPEMAVREEALPIVLPRQQEVRLVVWLAVRRARRSVALLLAQQGLPLEEWPVA